MKSPTGVKAMCADDFQFIHRLMSVPETSFAFNALWHQHKDDFQSLCRFSG